MKYTKPALTTEQQADLILERGLQADRVLLIERLSSVSYYRLSAYWHTFRQDSTETLRPGSTLDIIWDRYVFDRQLRVLVMDAIERVEIALRTQLTLKHAIRHGPFGYLDRANLGEMTFEQHQVFLSKIRSSIKQSGEDFVRHYIAKYTSETDLPIWMASELMTFGGMLTLFRHVETDIKREIAAQFDVADNVLESWLLGLNLVRNLCAHHARLWNKGFAGKALAIPRPRKHPEWHTPVLVTGDRMFGVLTVLRYLLKYVAPQSNWSDRFSMLIAQHPDIPIHFMGFPQNWTECPIWAVNAARVGSDHARSENGKRSVGCGAEKREEA